MSPTFIEILHPHDILVLDSVKNHKMLSDNRIHIFSTQTAAKRESWSMWFLPTLTAERIWNESRRLIKIHVNYLLNTAISFSRLRSLFCFFFTHFMANIFPVFFSFTMYTSENAPLLIKRMNTVEMSYWWCIHWLLWNITEVWEEYWRLAGSTFRFSQPVRASFCLLPFLCFVCMIKWLFFSRDHLFAGLQVFMI